MKEFEKWKKEYCKECGILETVDICGGDGCIETCNRRIGWEAALEWVLNIDSGFCNCGCPNDSVDNPSVLNKIKEELNERAENEN